MESSTKCQLQCPNCPTGAHLGKEAVVGWGSLSKENFKKLIDENPQIRHVELSNWGEMFLNKDLPDIIKYAFEKDVELTAANGTNFNSVPEKAAEALVKYRFKHLRVSIDGATQETYSKFRRNGNFERVIRNIETVNRFKEQYNSEYPAMHWVFITFSFNEAEIEMARAHAERLGMMFHLSMNHDDSFDRIEADHEGPAEPALAVRSDKDYMMEWAPCHQMWFTPQINFDGKLLGCCGNFHLGEYGNVFKSGFVDLLESEPFTRSKQMLLGEIPEFEESPCFNCVVFHKIRDKNLHGTLRKKLETMAKKDLDASDTDWQ